MRKLRAIICLSIVIGLVTGTVVRLPMHEKSNLDIGRVHFLRGKNLYLRGALNSALRELNDACKLNPKNSLAFIFRANVYSQLGEVALAIRDYDQSILLCDTNSAAYGNRAVLREKSNDLKGAISDWTSVIKLDPNQSLWLEKRGFCLQRSGNQKAAFEDFNQSIKHCRTAELSFLGRGIASFALGNTDSAVADCSRAAKLNCESVWRQVTRSPVPIASELRGIIRLEHGDLCGAVSEFTNAINSNEKNSWAYCGRGQAWSKLHNNVAAIADFDVALRIDPHYAVAYRCRGFAKYLLDREQDADVDYERAFQLDPHNAWELCRRGFVSLDKCDYLVAQRYFNKAIKVDSNRSAAYLGLSGIDPRLIWDCRRSTSVAEMIESQLFAI